MTLYTAQAIVLRDRMDWRKPHCGWLPSRLYRYFSER